MTFTKNCSIIIWVYVTTINLNKGEGTMTPQQQQISQFTKDGEILATVHALAQKLERKLQAGNFWSIEELQKIITKTQEEIEAVKKVNSLYV